MHITSFTTKFLFTIKFLHMICDDSLAMFLSYLPTFITDGFAITLELKRQADVHE